MLRVTLKGVLAHKLRLLLSVAAVVLGIAFVAGSFILSDTIKRTFDDLFTQTTADVVVEPKPAFGEAGGGLDSAQGTVLTVPASYADTLRGVPGVARVTGDVSVEGVRIVSPAGKVLGTGGAPGIGIDWSGDPSGAVTLTAGRGPASGTEVAIDSIAAEKGDITVGSTVSLLMPEGPRRTATVVGVFRFGSTGNLAGATLTAFDPKTAQSLLPEPDSFTSISAYVDKGVDQAAVRDRVDAALPDTVTAQTGEEQADEISEQIESSLAFITPILLGFAGIALFVGSFLIYNTFSMVVAQRTRELALLRAVGASRRQVTRSVLTEAGTVGVVGSLGGLGVGVLIVLGLRALMKGAGLDIASGTLVIAPRTIIVSLVVGLVVTLVTAYIPARRASRIPPVAAMRDEVAVSPRGLQIRAVVGCVLAAAGAVLLVSAVRSADGGSAGLLLAGGVLLALFGAIALAPVLSVPVVQGLGFPLRAVAGAVGRLSTQNARRNPRRTAVTASALMIGLTLITGIGVLASSAKVSIDRLVDDAIGADYVVLAGTGEPFSSDVADRIAATKGISSVVRERYDAAQLTFPDGTVKESAITAIGGAGIVQAMRLKAVTGDVGALEKGKALITEPIAKETGLTVGSTVKVLLASGKSAEVVVGGVAEENPGLADYSIPLPVLENLGGAARDGFLYVTTEDGSDAGAVRAAVTTQMAGYPDLDLRDQQQFKDANRKQINQVLAFIYVLLALAVVIAVLGIVNTLWLSVIERKREIGLMRAVGTTRGQLGRIVVLEAVVISTFGALLGLGLGLLFGVAVQQVLADEGITELAFPIPLIVAVMVAAPVVGTLAAALPAWRATRTNVLQAIATA